MWLSDLFSPAKNLSGSSAESTQPVNSDSNSTQIINQQIKALTPGSQLQGEILSKNGSEVRIRLEDDLEIAARLDSDVNVEVGKKITFEVKNNGSSLSLSPLFTNTAMTDNIMKALQAAGLPMTQKTVSMAETMMQQGMSIDSKSLQGMFKDVIRFPQAEASGIVELRQLGIPLTEENLQQIENYKNLNHELLKGMTDVLEELPAAFEALQGEKIQAGNEMFRALLANFLPDSAQAADLEKLAQLFAAQTSLQNGEALTETLAEAPALAGADLSGEDMMALQKADVSDAFNPVQEEKGAAEEQLLQEPASSGKETAALGGQGIPLKEILSDNEIMGLARMLQNLEPENPGLRQFAAQVGVGKTDLQTVLKTVSMLNPQGEEGKSALSGLFKSEAFQKLFQKQVLGEWTLEPKDLMEKSKVGELYRKLTGQLENMKEILQNAGAADSKAAQNAGRLSQNVDFMNQMNQLYTYVQLPLKMANGQKNGDLYVYTNKKSLASKDGNVSALLHLDMESLGPLDVYIAMQSERVSTRFTVRDDNILDFLQEHMDILNERLEKRGYELHCEMKIAETGEEKNPIEHILQKESGFTSVMQYGFDIRA